ncbi:MAG: NADP oxidoreductase [Betaproteobacteria bacterium CG2_30_68_42]|nr:MAG: NADP oxidoreductase [Betaproteobacteria bacterium CG2_30_68_42]PJA57546.1 MAG: NADP oxidoreductase [Rhodocyclales bacterium CG_4_9_14_3_um_filter_68_10]
MACDLPAIARRWGNDPANLVQILRNVQESCGVVPSETLDQLARLVGVARVRLEATASFYSFFHADSHGAYEVLFSDNIIDRHAGKAELMQYLCERLWVEPGKVSEDGLVYVDETSDIGLADLAPAMLVNGLAVPSLDKARIDLLAELIRSRKPLAHWPAMLFEVPDNVRRAGPLLGEPFEPGAALASMLSIGAEETLARIEASGLRGRGGAGYPTAAKWASCRKAVGDAHCVVCNADEGEPGTFKDRVLLASHADLVIEGMTVCARVIGARRGLIYLRGEYRNLLPALGRTLERRRAAGLLGTDILGARGFDFDIAIHLGAGAYICGEESALIESLEGKPGKPRNRPPFPDRCGYRGQPTVVNNVETFACAARIAERGAARFAGMGTPQSTGTKLISVSGDCARPGVYEVPFGVTVREVLAECGAKHAHAVQVSGPSGTCVSFQEFERRIAFEDLASAGAFMVFSRERDMFEVARNFTHFFAHESCGFCTPCRVGTSLLRNIMDKLAAGKGSPYDMQEMKRIMCVLRDMAHCGLGHTAANPVVQTMQKFPEAYERRLKKLEFEPAFDLDDALETARLITGRDDEWAHLAAD